MTLEGFIDRVDGFIDKPSSEQILFFGYYLMAHKGVESFFSKDIRSCFEQLHLPPYSNISAFLSKAKNEKRLVKCRNGGYQLARRVSEDIAANVNETIVKTPSNDLFPQELFLNTRSYLEKTAREASLCYDLQLYSACLVMIRRLLESLIIEIFERYGIQDRIRDKNGNYKYCGELIDTLLAQKDVWTIGRNTAKALPGIKTLGDMCAHNRRFNACKADVDKIKEGLRVALEELVLLGRFD